MNKDTKRLEFLEKNLQENPGDPFFKYALAMEIKTTDPSKAVSLLEELMEENPDYLATYYTLGKLLYEEEETDKALMFLKTGLDLAIRTKEIKAQNEIRNLISSIEMEI